jgi:hypothetical protein
MKLTVRGPHPGLVDGKIEARYISCGPRKGAYPAIDVNLRYAGDGIAILCGMATAWQRERVHGAAEPSWHVNRSLPC